MTDLVTYTIGSRVWFVRKPPAPKGSNVVITLRPDGPGAKAAGPCDPPHPLALAIAAGNMRAVRQ